MPSDRQVLDYEPVRPSHRRPGPRADDLASAWSNQLAHEADSAQSAGTQANADAAQTPAQEQPPAPAIVTGENWSRQRGHGLTYAFLFIFTAVLYFRPYEYLPLPMTLAFWIAILTLAVYVPTQFALDGNLTARPRELTLLLLLALAALLSIPLALNSSEALDTFSSPFLKAVLIFIVIINVVRNERRLKGLLWLALAISCTLSIGALNDYRQGNFSVEGYRVAGNIGGMFSNPNEMALHLVTMVPIAVGLLLSARGLLRKCVYGVCAALMVAGIAVTFSRGAFLGLIGMTGVLLWKLGRRNRIGITVLMVVGTVLFLALAPGGYSGRVLSIFNSKLDANDSSIMRQQVLWRSLYTALRHPLLGIGMGNFHIVSIRELVSHNAYTQVAAELGVAALVCYTLFIITPLRRLRQIERATYPVRRGSRFYYMAIGLQASLVAYMVSSFFASVAYTWYVYYLVAFAIALRRIYAAHVAETAAAQQVEHGLESLGDARAAALADSGTPAAWPGDESVAV